MASAEKTITLSSSGGNRANLYIYFNETDTSTSTNQSKIYVYGSITMTSGSFSVSSNPTLYIYWHNNATNNDTLLNSVVVNSLSRGNYSDVSGEAWFDHYSDGTGSGYAFATWSYSGSNAYVPASGTATTDNTALTTISRASIPTAIDGIIEETTTITTNRTSNDYYHTITFSCGNTSGTIGTNVLESIAWTIPATIYNELSSTQDNITITISCTTYQTINNVATQIGSTQTTTMRAYCGLTHCMPDYDFNLVLTDGTATSSLTGATDKIIAGYTTSELQWSATAKHGATIDRVVLINYDTSITTSPSNLYTDDRDAALLLVNGINTYCYDSRGMFRHLIKTYDIIEYFEPHVDMTLRRTSPTGSEVKILFNGSFFNDTFGSVTNSLTITWNYKEKGTSTWTTGGTLTNNTDYTINGNTFYSGTGSSASEITLSSSVFTYTKAYDIQLVLDDEINHFEVEKSIAKGKPIFWWDENGVYEGTNNYKFLTEETTGDLTNLTTSTKTDLVSSINEVVGKLGILNHYIRYKLTNRYNTTQSAWTHTKINLDTNWASKGNFTISNNGVVIGAGINTILVLAHINFSQSTTAVEWDLHIHKGTSSSIGYTIGWATTITNGALNSLDMATIMDVSQNDYIYLCYAAGNTSQNTIYEDTSLTIIAIN